jgi:hypothetical protein
VSFELKTGIGSILNFTNHLSIEISPIDYKDSFTKAFVRHVSMRSTFKKTNIKE